MIRGEELTVDALGPQAVMQPEGAAGGTTPQGAGREVQHPHGASNTYPAG